MARWSYRTDDMFTAIGADADPSGMDLGESAFPVVSIPIDSVVAPLFAMGIFRFNLGATVGQFSILKIVAPRAFGIWVRSLVSEGAGTFQFGASQNESSTPITGPTSLTMALITSSSVRANFSGAALGLVVQIGPGSANSEPVANNETFFVSSSSEYSIWQPVWIPPGRFFWAFPLTNNTSLNLSCMLTFPTVLTE